VLLLLLKVNAKELHNFEYMSKEEFYLKILDNIPADIAVLDQNSKYVFVNKKAIKNDARRAWIIGKTDLEYCEFRGIDPAIANARARLHKAAIDSREATKLEEEMVVEGKKSYNYRIIQPIFDGSDDLEFLLGYGVGIDEIKEKYEAVNKNLRLINSLNELLERHVGNANLNLSFKKILDDVIHLSDSKFGFIAEVLTDANGAPYIKTKAVSNIAWNEETRKLYEEGQITGMAFRNLTSIFGQVLTTRKPYISNTPQSDTNASGTPKGHPPLQSFIGIPFMQGEELIGMLGLANKEGGYTQSDVDYFLPLSQTLSIVLKTLKVQSENKSMMGLMRSKEQETLELIRNLKDIVLKLDENYTVLDISSEFDSFSGLNHDHIVGTDFTKLIKSEIDRADFIARVKSLQDNYGGNFSAIYKLSSNKIEKFFELKFSLVAIDGINYLLGRLSDISIHMESLNKINELAIVTEKTQNTVIIADSDGRINWVNQAFTDLLGYTLDEVKGKRSVDFLQNPFETEDMSSIVRAAMIDKKPFSGEIIKYTKDGRKLWFNVNFVFYKDNEDNERMISVASDITKLKLAENEILKSLAHEIHANKIKSQFVSLVSHEFRTPLASIQSSIDLFKLKIEMLDTKLIDDFKGTYSDVLHEIAKLTELMNTFLLKEKLNQTTLNPNKIFTDLNDCYSDLVKNIEQSQKSRPIKLVLPATSRSGMVDVSIMFIVLQNLISNANKYSGKSAKESEMSLNYQKNNYTVEVQDFGIGIPESDLPQIFNAFFRAKNVENIQGTGLGLNIVKEYVNALEGTIEITSKPGEGTRVKITLPY
jgi:PAS domain S-box-containing protein